MKNVKIQTIISPILLKQSNSSGISEKQTWKRFTYSHEEAYKLRPHRSHTLEAVWESGCGFCFWIFGRSCSNTSCSAFEPS